MKVLILGYNGMVGHVIALYFKERGHEVLGYDITKSNIINSLTGSFHSEYQIRKIINDGNFDAVINCTAIVNQFAEEDKAEAAFINAYFPHFLEDVTRGTNTIVVHRSTDCIFSGNRGQYAVNDIPDAISFYARTKIIGELLNEKDITIRTSLVGPEQDNNGIGLLNWFRLQKEQLNGYVNAIWTGLTTDEFAREIEYLINKRAHGLFHCVPSYAISKFELLELFEKQFPNNRKLNKIENKRVDKSLIQSIGTYGLQIPSYDDMIQMMSHWIEKHKELYPKY